MKKTLKGLLLVIMFVLASTITLHVPSSKAATQTDINTAIEKGLTYLVAQQNIVGYWENYRVASTAMAVLAFENAGHLASNLADPYHANVQKGLDYLFSVASVVSLGLQPAGNPDSNGNGIGIGWYSDGQPVYETPMVLMAIVGSQSPTTIATTGPANVIGRQYSDIVTDIVDWIAWGQSDATNNRRGGWRYTPNSNDADNSISQWPTLGLMTAELWGINAPAFVKTELAYWTAATQNLVGTPTTNTFYGAFDYQPGAGLNTIAETSTGIMQLTYLDASKTDPRIIAAEGYINRDWLTTSGWRVNLGNFYAMYAVMKACRLAIPTPIQFIANYDGTPGVEWYNGANEYADVLIAHQGADGHWDQWVAPESVPTNLCTAWGVLILEFVPVVVEYTLTVTVSDDTTTQPIPDATVTATGPDPDSPVSENTDNNGVAELTLQAGTYEVDISKEGYEPKSLTVDLVGGNVEVPPSDTRIEPTAPTVTPPADASGNEGSAIAIGDFTFTDSDPLETYTAVVYWGDSSSNNLGAVTSPISGLSHTYADNAVYTVTLTVTENDGASGSGSMSVTVNNVPPSITSILCPPDPIKVGTSLTVSGTFTDPGTLDTHTAIWYWGDGTQSSGAVTEASGSGSVDGSHTYGSTGLYVVTLKVTDKDGGYDEKTCTGYIVAYDPNGGFVTGGGWINSPQGAYAADQALTGKATFGFVSKYQKGTTVPTGNTEFQFHAGNLNFKSTSYDWLVVAGASGRAQFKGTGTINGAGNYGFMLTAIDGDAKSGDMFRIKIWDKATGNVVYDNQMGTSDTANPTTFIEGGSIVIH